MNYPINHNILAEDFREKMNPAVDEEFTQADARWLYESLVTMCNAYDDAIEDDTERLLKQSTTTTGFEPNVMWTPFIEDGRAGFRCQELGTENVTFIYMNPSTDGDEGSPDVFVYMGDENDPALDVPLHFYTPSFREVEA